MPKHNPYWETITANANRDNAVTWFRDRQNNPSAELVAAFIREYDLNAQGATSEDLRRIHAANRAIAP